MSHSGRPWLRAAAWLYAGCSGEPRGRLRVCGELEGCVEGLVVNHRIGSGFLHVLVRDGRVASAAATPAPVEPEAYAGIVECLLSSGIGAGEAMEHASRLYRGGGFPESLRYNALVLSAYRELPAVASRIMSRHRLYRRIAPGGDLVVEYLCGEWRVSLHVSFTRGVVEKRLEETGEAGECQWCVEAVLDPRRLSGTSVSITETQGQRIRVCGGRATALLVAIEKAAGATG